MNLIILSGRLTGKPEAKQSSSGSVVAHFSIAVDDYNGKEKVADFFNCVAFGKRAEFCEKYLDKGIKVTISGKLKNNNYTDKNGVKQYRNQIVINDIEFCESKKNNSNNNSNNNDNDGFEYIDSDTEELPFN